MDTMGGKEIPIETFDALLRDLVTWDLVVRGEGDDSQTWRLVARAQQRLGELMIARGPWPAERTVYLDRLCADCGPETPDLGARRHLRLRSVLAEAPHSRPRRTHNGRPGRGWGVLAGFVIIGASRLMS